MGKYRRPEIVKNLLFLALMQKYGTSLTTRPNIMIYVLLLPKSYCLRWVLYLVSQLIDYCKRSGYSYGTRIPTFTKSKAQYQEILPSKTRPGFTGNFNDILQSIMRVLREIMRKDDLELNTSVQHKRKRRM